MKYTNFKNLNLSSYIFGGAALSSVGKGYGFGEVNDLQAQELVECALDCGINLFDTAPIYGFGLSEKRLGRFLHSKRDSVYLISKSGVSWHDSGRVNMTNDPKVTKSMLEDSLRRLSTDYIDIYMVHWPDANVDIRRTVEVLAKAQLERKIKYIGLCNTNDDEILKASEICSIDFIQSEFNLFNNGFEAVKSLENRFSMGWGTLDKGILAGHLTTDTIFESSDARSWAPWWKKSNWKEKVKVVEQYSLAKDVLPIKQLAIMYSQKSLNGSICGAKSAKQLKELLNLVDVESFDGELLNNSLKKFNSLL